jgi:hypothetical protein
VGERRLPDREHERRARLQQRGRRGHRLTRRGRSVEGDQSWTVVRVHLARIFERAIRGFESGDFTDPQDFLLYKNVIDGSV